MIGLRAFSIFVFIIPPNYEFFIPKNNKVLEIGCGTGELLKQVEPSYGVGIDFSEKMIDIAQQNFPQYQFQNN